MTRSDRVATLEEAKAQFQKSWDAWKAWAKLEGNRVRRLEQRGAVAFAAMAAVLRGVLPRAALSATTLTAPNEASMIIPVGPNDGRPHS